MIMDNAFRAARRSPVLAVRDGKWKLMMELDGTETELFDLEAEPSERRNLADEHPDTVQKLQAQ
jgi:hypothetical protein